ncbi:MAG: acetate--CoA ligase family protein [Chloroflexi bacterium]|nr:acetate--CoA ligase family protein [Chloroflexota bacterium]
MTSSEAVVTARREHRTVLTEVESKALVQAAGIPVVETRLAHSAAEAVSLAQQLGFPVVLKITSPDILHKSDVGGVRVGLKSTRSVAQAYREVLAAARSAVPTARIHGVSVQQMAPPGVEVILGASKDPQFGPFLMFGLGGVLVEVLKDVSFRLVPLTPRDAGQMVREIKGYPILQGYRGHPPADVARLEQAVLQLSGFMEAHPEIKELDLNPVFVYQSGLAAVDARIILEEMDRQG